MKKINLEEIILKEFGQLSIDVMKGAYSRNEDPRSLLKRWQEVMKEACRQALDLAAENAECEEVEVAESIHGGDGYTYTRVDKDSILNTINQIE